MKQMYTTKTYQETDPDGYVDVRVYVSYEGGDRPPEEAFTVTVCRWSPAKSRCPCCGQLRKAQVVQQSRNYRTDQEGAARWSGLMYDRECYQRGNLRPMFGSFGLCYAYHRETNLPELLEELNEQED
jgi:hypothetical protein